MKALLAMREGMLIICFIALIVLIYLNISILETAITTRQEIIILKLDRIERTLNNANS